MPELPDITIYQEAIMRTVGGLPLRTVTVFSPFALKSVSPKLEEFRDRRVVDVRRLGKRLALGFEGDSWLVIHLMIAGRFLWQPGAPKSVRPGGKATVALLEFEPGCLLLTEAGSKHRATITAIAGSGALAAHDPGGIEPWDCSLEQFQAAIQSQNRTLKRALTDPKTFSGIGNAYSDEILHAARLSPIKLTSALSAEEIGRLWKAVQTTLADWTDRLRSEFGDRFPGRGQITAFRPDFAAHGKFGQPCPVCGKPIQRIRYAENETNYCAVCQNGGVILADRSLSRLLKSDWPRSFDD